MTPAEILNKAADLIETGWTQDTYYDNKCYCADGALQVAAGIAEIIEDEAGSYWDDIHRYDDDLFGSYMEAYRAASVAAGRTSYGIENIIGYNDIKGRTADEVIAVLRDAAEVSAL